MNTLRIYIVGVGGQGNVLASKMIGEAALSMGVPVLMSETHGMAQRGGVVESTVVLGGAQSPTISDNCADILLAFEPMEAVRALSKANADTIVITNTAPVVPFIPGGSAAYPPVDDLPARQSGPRDRVRRPQGIAGSGQPARPEHGHARRVVRGRGHAAYEGEPDGGDPQERQARLCGKQPELLRARFQGRFRGNGEGLIRSVKSAGGRLSSRLSRDVLRVVFDRPAAFSA